MIRCRSALPLLLCALASPACGLHLGSVTRVVDGIPEEGRFVSPEAYSAYARGAYFEARGELGPALDAYRSALEEDSGSPEIHTRIGAVRCKALGAAAATEQGSAWHEATRAFDTALDLDAAYAPAWHEKAVCLARASRFDEALVMARNGVTFDPDRIDSSLLMADLYVRLGQTREARTWLDAIVTRWPSSRPAALALLGLAQREGDRGRELRARELLREHRAYAELSGPVQPSPPARPLDLALARGDLAAARRAALGAGISAGELAAHAVIQGQLALAREQAELVSAADPADSDAWIAGLVAADLARDEAGFLAWLGRLDRSPTVPHPLAARLLAELLGRRSSADAAGAWLSAYGTLPGAEGAGAAR